MKPKIFTIKPDALSRSWGGERYAQTGDDASGQMGQKRDAFLKNDHWISIETGSVWCCFLDIGFTDPFCWRHSVICSQRVIDDMEKAAITGLNYRKVELKKYLSGWKKPPPKDYYVLLPEPGVSVDIDKCNYTPDRNGEAPYGGPTGDDPIWQPFFGLNYDSWNGKDLFGYRNKYGGKRADEMVMDVLCTEKVAELAKRKKWSNCSVKERPWEMVEGVDPNAEKRAEFLEMKKLLNDDQDEEVKALNDHLRSLRSD